MIFSPVRNLFGLELSPGFVERHPHGDAGIAVETVHDLAPFLAVVSLALRSALKFLAVEIITSLPFRIFVAARHILPNDDAVTVTISVPQCGLNLYMLADHIVAPVFCLVHVKDHCFVRWRGV